MDFENLLNFERASVATYYDANGVLQTAAIDEPRLDHDPVTLEPLGLLVEEGRTNIYDYSESSTGMIGDPDVTITDNNGIAPDGSNTLIEFDFLNGSPAYPYVVISVEGGQTYTYSYWVKLGTSSPLNNAIYDHTNSAFILDSAQIVGLDTELRRVSLTFTTPASCTQVRVYPLRASGQIGTVYCWGFQLEKGTFPTSYIPTTGAPATRSPDVCSVKSVDPWIDQNEGTLYVQLNKKAGSYVGNYLTLSDGSADNQVVIKDRSVFYKETNYMPSPFDPSGWSGAGDPDLSYTSVTEENPSGATFVGEFEYIGPSFGLVTDSFAQSVSGSGVFYNSILVKTVNTQEIGFRLLITNELGTAYSESFFNASSGAFTNTFGETSDVKFTSTANGYSVIQTKMQFDGSESFLRSRLYLYKVSSSTGIQDGFPSTGDKIKCQAAFFGKANDWPVVISDTNVIQAGTNNLTGAQSFAAPLESGESKLALSYDGSTYSAAKDGVAFSGVNAGVPVLTDLYIGSGEDGSTRYFNGHIIDAQYFPRKLDESELVDLTT